MLADLSELDNKTFKSIDPPDLAAAGGSKQIPGENQEGVDKRNDASKDSFLPQIGTNKANEDAARAHLRYEANLRSS